MQTRLFIDGRWIDPVRGGSLDVIEPATESLIPRVAAAGEEDVGNAASCFDGNAGLAGPLDARPHERIGLADARFTSKAAREPLGVAGAIVPWNHPLSMVRKVPWARYIKGRPS